MKNTYRQLCNTMNHYTIKVNDAELEFSYYGYLDEAIKHATWLSRHNKCKFVEYTNKIELHGQVVAYEEWKMEGDGRDRELVSNEWQHIA